MEVIVILANEHRISHFYLVLPMHSNKKRNNWPFPTPALSEINKNIVQNGGWVRAGLSKNHR